MSSTIQDDRPRGRVEVITGGMFSGKSEELVRRLRRAFIARQRVQVFKPATDTRVPGERLVTRDNRELAAISVRNASELIEWLDSEVDVVGIDEAQFFGQDILDAVDRLADRGVRVVVAGLDLDYLRRPFGPMPLLLARAEYVDKMHAVCVRCGGTAHYSQRTAGGGEQIQVGDGEAYEARCRSCYEPFTGRGEVASG
ncbi:MAG: thymidine kinase [Acidobacteriota bacterium]|jgi:thymidine kinase